MLARLLAFVLEQRFIILILTVLLIGLGVWSAVQLPIDAVPDITSVQVQINTSAPALSPLEVERQITYPIESAMAGIPRVEEVRSLSKFGLSQVTVVFHDGTDIYFARQLVQQRLQQVSDEIPPGFGTPQMAPISTGLGEIFEYTVESPHRDLMELRTIQDWMVKPQLRTVPGVADVNSWGGFEKQYQILVRPEALVKYGLPLEQVLQAVAANNVNVGGGYILKGAERYVVRGVGRVQTLDQIANIVLASREDGFPVRVGDVAEVIVGPAIRHGAITKDGQGEAVIGVVMMLMGANSRIVTNEVKARIGEIAKTLPKDVKIKPYYDRSELVNRTIHTVEKNLFEGALLVIAVLFLLMGNVRAAIIVALAIPLSMLFAFNLMLRAGIAGSLMSLGAIDFGLIVDSSVIIVENSVRRLAERKKDEAFLPTLLDACLEVRKATIFGELIIMVVYLPILTLQGVEGKLFRPMALTVVFALGGSLVLSLTLIPVLVSLLLRGKLSERESLLVRWAKRRYEPTLKWCLGHKKTVLLVAVGTVLAALLVSPFLGSEFIPKLDEGAFMLEMRRLPGISLEEAVRLKTVMQQHLLAQFPDEISATVARIGRAEIATDPMEPSVTCFAIYLRQRKYWRKASNRDELIDAMDRELKKFLGVTYEFSQPIELRTMELIAGVRSDIAIRIYGDDMDVLREKAEEVVVAVSRIRGARGFRAQQVMGLPMLQIVVEPEKLARYGVNAADVMRGVEAIGGIEATEVLEGRMRFPLVIRLPAAARRDKEAIGNLLVSAPRGERVPLQSLCRIEEVEGLAEISHRNGYRLIVVEGNVRGRDMGSFVEEAKEVFEHKDVILPPGYRAEFGGQFEHYQRARNRLLLIVPLSLLLIFLLLFMTFGSARQAALVFTGVPLAMVGGVFSLLLRGMPFSISAGVGFIALFGVSVLNGLVMVSYINRLREEGRGVAHAVREGALVRLRPVLMTALVASFGFVPMAVSTSAGAEVQRPLATVVIGGLITSTLLTLLVLPVLYTLIERELLEVEL